MTKPKKNSKDSREEESFELSHARQVIIERLERFKIFLNGRNLDNFQIEARLKSVEDDFSEFDRIQTRLEYLIPDEKENRLDTESEFYSKISLAKKLIAEADVSSHAICHMYPLSPYHKDSELVARLPDFRISVYLVFTEIMNPGTVSRIFLTL